MPTRSLTPSRMLSNSRSLSKNRELNTSHLIGKQEAIIAITFDDGARSDYMIAYWEMEKRGMRGTSYVNTSSIGGGAKLTWLMIKNMLRDGWAVECHTHTHARLTDLTEQQIRDELEAVDTEFAAQGLDVPEHHAYPYLSHDATVRSVVAEYRDTARRGGAGLQGYNDIDYTQMTAKAAYLEVDADLDVIKGIIDTAVAEDKILILYTHSIHDSVFPSGGCLTHLFVEMLEYIKNKRVRVVTIPQLYDYVEALV